MEQIKGYTTFSCDVPCGECVGVSAAYGITWPSAGGKKCPPLFFTRYHHAGPCPAGCNFTAWKPIGKCDHATHKVTVVREQLEGPSDGSCGPTVSSHPCSVALPHYKPVLPNVHCKVTEWGPWSTCTKTCGSDGTKTRRRSVNVFPQNEGRSCPPLEETVTCNLPLCPRNCKVGGLVVAVPCGCDNHLVS